MWSFGNLTYPRWGGLLPQCSCLASPHRQQLNCNPIRPIIKIELFIILIYGYIVTTMNGNSSGDYNTNDLIPYISRIGDTGNPRSLFAPFQQGIAPFVRAARSHMAISGCIQNSRGSRGCSDARAGRVGSLLPSACLGDCIEYVLGHPQKQLPPLVLVTRRTWILNQDSRTVQEGP